jgi:hypothetical protein
MTTSPFLDEVAKEIGIPESNTLVLTDKRHKASGGQDNEDFYFDEVDPNGTVVNKYHYWAYFDFRRGCQSGYTKLGTEESN